MEKLYVAYDSRARGGEPEGATVLDVARSLKEVSEYNKYHKKGRHIWYEYYKGKGKNEWICETMRPGLEKYLC